MIYPPEKNIQKIWIKRQPFYELNCLINRDKERNDKNQSRKKAMSTIIMLSLATIVIFWRPPFKFPHPSKKMIMPILMIIILSSLILLGIFKSTSNGDCCQKTVKQNESSGPLLRQSTFEF